MKKYLLFYSISLLCSSLPLGTVAQETTQKTWTLEDCIQYAEANNYSINSLKLSKETSNQSYLQSKAAVLPNLNANGNMTFNHTGTTFNTDSEINSSGDAGVSSSWTLYNGGYLQKDIEQKKIAIRSADLFLEQGKNNINLQITQAYLNILLDKENIRYNTDLVSTSAAQLAQMQLKFDVGSAAKKDVVQLEAQLAKDKYNLATSLSTERLDKLSLKQLLLLPSDTTFEVQQPDTLFSVAILPPLQEVQSVATDFLPDVKISELGLQSSKLDLSKARSGYLPVVSLSAGLGSNLGNTANYNLNNNFYQQAGVSVSMPLFSRRVNKTNIEKAKIGIAQAELDVHNTRISVSQTVEKAYLNALNSQNQYQSAKEQMKYNEEALRISSEELKIGSANMVDYIQQRNLYVQGLQQFIQAKYNAAMYLKIYEFYKGTPLSMN
ncbi:MAG: TolC family protein [Taibaiella sp.]|jgi:outer membrane protein